MTANEAESAIRDETTAEEPAVTVYVDVDPKKYFRCNMYYMRRVFGLREALVLVALLAVGLTLFFLMRNLFILVLFGVCVALILFALALFVLTGKGGYRADMERPGIKKQMLEFKADALEVTSIGGAGNGLMKETHPYDRLERISIKPKRIYIYAQAAVFYYVFASEQPKETYDRLCEFLRASLGPEMFEFRKRRRRKSMFLGGLGGDC